MDAFVNISHPESNFTDVNTSDSDQEDGDAGDVEEEDDSSYSNCYSSLFPDKSNNDLQNIIDKIIALENNKKKMNGLNMVSPPYPLKKKASKQKGQKRVQSEKDAWLESNLEIVNSLKDLNRTIKAFIRNDTMQSIPLPPYNRETRKLIHELANAYFLKSQSKGNGNQRHPVLIKTKRTSIPSDFSKIDRIINRKNNFSLSKSESPHQTKSKSSSSTYKKTSDVDGTVVGANAIPIEETNVGNQMLRKLGWSPGMGLGARAQGEVVHVEAVVKNNKKGLGS